MNGRWQRVLKRSIAVLVVLGAALAVMEAAARSPKISVTALVPAQSSEAARIRSIGVMPFDGASGQELAGEIEGLLAGIVVDDSPYFSVAERTRRDVVISEIKWSQSRMISPEQAKKAGKLMGVEGLYMGTAERPVWSESHTQEGRQVCTQAEKKNNVAGYLGFNKCLAWANHTVQCSKKEVVYSFTPKLVDIETGRIVYSNVFTGGASTARCADNPEPAVADALLLEHAKNQALEDFRKAVAPSYSKVDIHLIESSQSIDDKTAKKKHAQGIEFAKANRLDRACELWHEAAALAAPAMPILYGLGVCAEVSGEIDAAQELYRKADRLLDKPDERISAALVRVAKAKKDSAVINTQRGE